MVEIIKTHILYSISFFFFRNRAFYEIMWKNIVEPGRPLMAIWRMRIACWLTKATCSFTTSSIYFFSTAKMVARRARMLRCRGQLKCDGTRAETRYSLSAKRTSPFKSARTSVQSTSGSRDVRISSSNAGYTMFQGSVKGTGYPHHSSVSPSVRHRVPSHFSWSLLNGLSCFTAQIAQDVLTLRRLMSYIYMEHPFLMFLDHTQRRSTVGRTPLDE